MLSWINKRNHGTKAVVDVKFLRKCIGCVAQWTGHGALILLCEFIVLISFTNNTSSTDCMATTLAHDWNCELVRIPTKNLVASFATQCLL